MSKIDLSYIDLNLLVTFEVLMREGSVTRAAERLGRTQSAVSHALARLRDQLGDPLMVRSGGRMSPSPFALRLIEDVRPILRDIQRVIAAPEPFDPKTSERIFRIAAPDWCPAVMAGVIGRVQREAPGVGVEWVQASAEAYTLAASGLIDVTELAGSGSVPEGLEVKEGPAYTRKTYVRKGHPAIRTWGIEEWSRWPHLKVVFNNGVPSTVDHVEKGGGPTRRVGAWIPNLFAVAPLLARTDMLGTFPPLMMREALEQYGLRVLEPPVPIEPMPMRFVWSFRLSNDPGSTWFRNLVIDVFTQAQRDADRAVERAGVVEPRRARKTRTRKTRTRAKR